MPQKYSLDQGESRGKLLPSCRHFMAKFAGDPAQARATLTAVPELSPCFFSVLVWLVLLGPEGELRSKSKLDFH